MIAVFEKLFRLNKILNSLRLCHKNYISVGRILKILALSESTPFHCRRFYRRVTASETPVWAIYFICDSYDSILDVGTAWIKRRKETQNNKTHKKTKTVGNYTRTLESR